VFDLNVIIENIPRTPKGLAVFLGGIGIIIGAISNNSELFGAGLVLAILGLIL
jgi:hypothetical protein